MSLGLHTKAILGLAQIANDLSLEGGFEIRKMEIQTVDEPEGNAGEIVILPKKKYRDE